MRRNILSKREREREKKELIFYRSDPLVFKQETQNKFCTHDGQV